MTVCEAPMTLRNSGKPDANVTAETSETQKRSTGGRAESREASLHPPRDYIPPPQKTGTGDA